MIQSIDVKIKLTFHFLTLQVETVASPIMYASRPSPSSESPSGSMFTSSLMIVFRYVRAFVKVNSPRHTQLMPLSQMDFSIGAVLWTLNGAREIHMDLAEILKRVCEIHMDQMKARKRVSEIQYELKNSTSAGVAVVMYADCQ